MADWASHFKVVGHGLYTDLETSVALLNALGSNQWTLVVPRGNHILTDDLTVNENIRLIVHNGASIDADDYTLKVNGLFEAGPYPILSWDSGSIDLTDSPTAKIPIQWFGALTGISNDCSSALEMAIVATGNNQYIYFTNGLWRIANPITIDKSIPGWYGGNIRMKGDCPRYSNIYIDVGANIGITIGKISSDRTRELEIKGLSFIGPSNCCTNAIKIIDTDLIDIEANFYLGSTDYFLDVQGCINFRGRISNQGSLDSINGLAQPAYGIKVEDSSDYQSNLCDLWLDIGSITYDAVNILGTTYYSDITNISGAIQGYGRNPLLITNQTIVDLNNLHIEGSGSEALLDRCRNVNIKGLVIGSSSGQADLRLRQCSGVLINSSSIGSDLYIENDCRGIIIGNFQCGGQIYDDAPDTQYLGNVTHTTYGNNQNYSAPGHDAKNIIYNSIMDRWNSINADCGYDIGSNSTWTKCGIGLGDTNRHQADYCAKIVISGGDNDTYLNLDASQLRQIKGKWINFTQYLMIDGSQTFNSYPYGYMEMTVPNYVGTTVYNIGDGVNVSGDKYICIAPGTSTGSPTWDDTIGNRTADGANLIWECISGNIYSTLTTPFTAADIGKWKQMRIDFYLPNNATALAILAGHFPRQTGNADATYYLAEPCLMLGRHGPRGAIGGQTELRNFIQIGDKRLWTTTPSAGAWVAIGDIDLSSGQRCTVAGAQGSGATWSNFP